MSDDIEDTRAALAADGVIRAEVIPPVADDVYSHTVRARFAADPGFAAAETSLLHRNDIDPGRVLIDTYERHGAEVSFSIALLDADGKRQVDRSNPDELRLVTEDIATTLVVYP